MGLMSKRSGPGACSEAAARMDQARLAPCRLNIIRDKNPSHVADSTIVQHLSIPISGNSSVWKVQAAERLALASHRHIRTPRAPAMLRAMHPATAMRMFGPIRTLIVSFATWSSNSTPHRPGHDVAAADKYAEWAADGFGRGGASHASSAAAMSSLSAEKATTGTING
jgi:hypothetical protein